MPCCSNSEADICACACCRYPNGAVQTIMAQLLLFIGLLLSVATISDCKFVEADTSSLVPSPFPDYLEGLFPTEPTRRGLGFVFFQDNSGECYWSSSGGLWDWYQNSLGSNWNVGRALGSTAAGLAVLLWIWVLMAGCIAHPKGVRYLIAALHILILMPLQYATFSVLRSDFCNDANCKMSRSAWFSIFAGLCFVFSGVLFCVMKDYPGRVVRGEAAAVEAKHYDEEEAQQQEEEEEGPGEEEEQEKEVVEAEEEPEAAVNEEEAKTDEKDVPTNDDDMAPAEAVEVSGSGTVDTSETKP